MMAIRRSSMIAIVASVVVIGGAVAGSAYALTSGAIGPRTGAAGPASTSSAAPSPTSTAYGAALVAPTAAASTDAPLPAAAAVAAALTGPLADPRLGASVLAQVTDATTGQLLYGQSPTTAAAPASTAKIATAAAVLATHGDADRITTTVVAGGAGQIVLVGAGDPTLSGAAAGTSTPYAGAARLSDLAAQLKAAGVAVTRVTVDGGLFTGPATAPSWQPDDVPTDYASPITAVMSDGGRDTPTAPIRSASPDLAAGAELAADLGLPATVVARGVAPAGAKVLASVQSATYGQLVEQMLSESDNVIAEVLGRQVAISQHQPASFTGAAASVRAVLTGLGVDLGAGMSDASGLAAGDRIAPASLVVLLRVATQNGRLRPVIDDLPVAGWEGTLDDRFTTAPASAGAGLVRAKTGTLTSVSTLAGIVTTAKGRVLLFSFVAAKVGPTDADTSAAEAALDVAAAALVGT